MTPREATVLGRAIKAGAVRPGSHFTFLSADEHARRTAAIRPHGSATTAGLPAVSAAGDVPVGCAPPRPQRSPRPSGSPAFPAAHTA